MSLRNLGTGPRSRLRWALPLIAMIGLLALATLYAPLHRSIERLVILAQGAIAGNVGLGAVVFVLLAAASAVLAFFSSTLLIPVAVATWGPMVTMALLWTGWVVGGIVTYVLGRLLGSALVKGSGDEGGRAFYERRLSSRTRFVHVLLFQLGVPSEIPGYVLGTLRYPFAKFLAATALAELPYAMVATWVGAGFLGRQLGFMLSIGLGGVALCALAYHLLHRRLGPMRRD